MIEQSAFTKNAPAVRASRPKIFMVLRFALRLSISAALLSIIAGLGSRWEIWHFRTGIGILKWSGYIGIIAAMLSIVGIAIVVIKKAPRRYALPAAAGLFISLSLTFILWHWYKAATTLPAIHDITTDTENPPAFVAILPIRKNAPNPAEYGGPEIAAQQRKAYPDIRTIILNIQPDQAFERILSIARDAMCWEIVDADKTNKRIEATDTTLLFGFKDDIVVRITPSGTGSLIDVRSVSRVGKSDVGTNAKRIKKFIKRLQ